MFDAVKRGNVLRQVRGLGTPAFSFPWNIAARNSKLWYPPSNPATHVGIACLTPATLVVAAVLCVNRATKGDARSVRAGSQLGDWRGVYTSSHFRQNEKPGFRQGRDSGPPEAGRER